MKRSWILFLTLFCMTISVIPVAAADSSEEPLFSDIETHWAKSTVETMATIKVFSGYPDGTFHPDKPLTRAEFLASIGRAADMGLSLRASDSGITESPFQDVKQGDWFWGDVQKAWGRGWVTPQDYGQALHPNDPVPRKEIARIIVRLASQLQIDVPTLEAVTFADVNPASPYYSDIQSATKLGVLSGYPDGAFKPDGTLTRAEASTVILRTLQLDMPKSPYASEEFTGAWEPSKIANMFIFAGWEEAFTQKGESLDLSSLSSFASDKAIIQYKSYLEFAKIQPDIDTSSNSVWMGEVYPYPTYINNNIALVSWYLSFDKKIEGIWYTQQTQPFTILLRREENRKWVVEDFPILIPQTNQKDWDLKYPSEPDKRLTFQYVDPSGAYYGHIFAGSIVNPQQSEAVPAINALFSKSPGKLKILRIMGMTVEDSPHASLVNELEKNQTIKQVGNGVHQLVVLKTGNWFDFTEGTAEVILERLWGNFNFNGGQYVTISLDGIPWTLMSDDPFWRKLQNVDSSNKVKEDSQQLSQELERILEQYTNKN